MSPAQFSSDPNAPLLVGTGGNEQVQPKVVATPDGAAYVSWFDNQSGGYDVRLARVDALGSVVWNILIADRSFSSTVDYDLGIDAQGNALITFNDDRFGGNQITVQKMSPAGAALFGTAGLTLTSDSNFKANPKVVALEDGSYAVAWTSGSGWQMRRISSLGVPAPTTLTVIEGGRSLSLSDLERGIGDQVIALWVRPTGTAISSSRQLYAQRYDANNVPGWNSGAPVQVYAPLSPPVNGSIQLGYFPSIQSDTMGGFVVAWYENSSPRRAYVQRINVEGNKTMGQWGAALTEGVVGRIWTSASVAFDPYRLEYYAVAQEVNASNQAGDTLVAQKFDEFGVRQWTESGITLVSSDGFQNSFTQAARAGAGMSVLGFDAGAGGVHSVLSVGVREDGTPVTPAPVFIAGNGTSKGRLATTTNVQGGILAAWSDGGTGLADIALSLSSPEGGIGLLPNTLTGQVNLGLDPAAASQVPIQVTLIGEGNATATRLVLLDANGNFSVRHDLTGNDGTINVRIDGPHMTSRFLNGVSAVNASIGTITLINGDANDDGLVDGNDINLILGQFGVERGSAAYRRNLDLNADGIIDGNDINTVLAGFGAEDEG